jgi:hypothetical protein
MLGGLQVAGFTASPDQDHLLETRKRCAEENVLPDDPQARDANGTRARFLGPKAVNGELPPVTRTLMAVEKRPHSIEEVPIRVEFTLEDFRWTGAHAQTAPGAEIADLGSWIQRDCILRADFHAPPAGALSEPDLLTQPGGHRDARALSLGEPGMNS